MIDHECPTCPKDFKEEEEPEESDSAALEKTRNPDGTVRLRNPNIALMDEDILYHLALSSGSDNLVEMFSDVKFVCMGGTAKRMEHFAYYIMEEIGHKLPTGTQLLDISRHSYRYSLFKVGPVIAVSHGMGEPSIGILLHELIKLMYHAKCSDPIFFRIGTCGGIGLDGGTVVISENAVDGMLNRYYQIPMLGKIVKRPANFDKNLVEQLKSLSSTDDTYKTVSGTTMCTDDFYEGQGRLDGAFCDYTEADKMEFLQRLKSKGVTNIEMETLAFGAIAHHARIRAAAVCVALLNRLEGDQISTPKEVLDEWQCRPQNLVSRYIRKYL